MRLFELGARAPRRRHLCDQARPHLEDLVTQTRSAVHLVLLEGLDALVLEHLTAPGHGAHGSDVGCRLPLHCSAAGRALLAHGPGDLVRQVLARGLPRRTPRTDTTAAGLARALERARARGVAVEVEELALGYVAVGAPVLDPAGRVAAAVSATVPTHAADVGLLARRRWPWRRP